MQVQVKVSDAVTIVGEGETHLEVFKNLAELQEVFGEIGACGKCKNPYVTVRVRVATDEKKKKEYTYPELVCQKCYAKFTFGQMEGGKLFPVRYLREDGAYVKGADGKNIEKGSRGWTHYNKETKKEE